jgi:hypothetical protein
MTPQLTTEAFAALGAPELVYIRPIQAREIMGATPIAASNPTNEGGEVALGFELTPDQILYAVHRADGARLAILTDRPSAVAAALAHELAPVSVH